MKPLVEAAADYLTLRHALGFKLYHETWWLPDFVAYVGSQGSSTITAELALRWAQQPADGNPNWWARKLGAVRRFARYHHACDPRTEVPPPDLLPYRPQRQTPYIYTDAEVAALLQSARCLFECGSFPAPRRGFLVSGLRPRHEADDGPGCEIVSGPTRICRRFRWTRFPGLAIVTMAWKSGDRSAVAESSEVNSG